MTHTNAWFHIAKTTPVARAVSPQQTDAEVFIYGDIGESWCDETVTAKEFVDQISALDVTNITVRINSIGGSVVDGLAIYNALKRHPATITTCIDGVAMSIASLIAMAGDEVQMSENAMFMVHAPWTGIYGNAQQLRVQADVLDKWSQSMCSSYVAQTGKRAEEMMALLTDGVDHYYTGPEALAAGFVDTLVNIAPVAAYAGPTPQALARYNRSASQTGQPAAAAVIQPVAQATTPKETPMPQGTDNAAAIEAAKVQARTEALAQDQERRSAISAAAKPFMAHTGMDVFVAELQNDVTMSAHESNKRILARLGSAAQPLADGNVQTIADEGDKRREAVVNAMLLRANVADEKVRASAGVNPYRGRTLLALAEASLQAAGIRTEGMDKREIVASAFTQGGSDFPVLLESVMHKTLLNAYATQALTWSRFCKRGTVSDFRAHTRYRVGSLGNLQVKNELGEYKSMAIPDGEKSTITAITKGFIISISREAVINDDLGALTDQSTAMGRSAARTIEADVYASLLSNSGMGPLMTDGLPLFDEAHKNIVASPGGMSVDQFDSMRVLMSQQTDVSGNDFLDLRPEILLCPVGLGGAARVINGAEYDVSVSNKFQVPNKVRGLFNDIVDTPRLSGTAFYALASLTDAPAIEVAFLDGMDQPYLELENGFTTDGARYKVRLDYGVAGHDWRGAVRNAGV